MKNPSAIKTIRQARFTIEASTGFRTSLWFSEYQILIHGQVISPWQPAGLEGLQSESRALDCAMEKATEDINGGLAALFP
jgi:hypothetical protein